MESADLLVKPGAVRWYGKPHEIDRGQYHRRADSLADRPALVPAQGILVWPKTTLQVDLPHHSGREEGK